MRYPFYPYKVDSDFLEQVRYGLHEGVDINGLGGGNTDCGYELFPITNCRIVHVSESNSNYGNLVVYEITGSFGTYWVRYAHCEKILVNVGDVVDRGTPIATMGNTGNSSHCHLHFDIFEQIPTTWRWYKNDRSELEKYLVHPLEFIQKNKNLEGTKQDSDALSACMKDREKFWKERDEAFKKVEELKIKLADLAVDNDKCQNDLSSIKADVSEHFEHMSRMTDQNIDNFEKAYRELNKISGQLEEYKALLEKKQSKEPAWEALKEPLRWFAIGALSFVVTYMIDNITQIPQTEITVLLTLALRGLDKYIHEYSKKHNKQVRGLVPF